MEVGTLICCGICLKLARLFFWFSVGGFIGAGYWYGTAGSLLLISPSHIEIPLMLCDGSPGDEPFNHVGLNISRAGNSEKRREDPARTVSKANEMKDSRSFSWFCFFPFLSFFPSVHSVFLTLLFFPILRNADIVNLRSSGQSSLQSH